VRQKHCSLVYDRSKGQSRQRRTKSKVTNQPDTHMTESLNKSKFYNSNQVFVQYHKITTGLYQHMTHHVTLQKTAVQRSCINCHSNFSALPIIATKFLSTIFIPKFQYSHVCIKWSVHTSNLTDMTAATSMTHPFITITDFQKLLHFQNNYLRIRPSVIKAVH